MLSFEEAIRLGLLFQPRTENDYFDLISMIHSFLVVLLGFFILIIEAAFDMEISKISTFLSHEPSKPITLLFTFSIFYYLYDCFAMAKQYKINNKSSKRLDEITSSNTYFVGFILHHLLCIYGLSCPLYNKWHSIPEQQFGRLVLLCFMLGELPNIPRLAHKIISRRFLSNTGNVHNNTLHSIYFVFKGCFIWCRLGVIQLTWNMLQPLAPMNVVMSAWLLNIFGVIAVCWEWRMMQFKNYQASAGQNNPYANKQN